MNTLITGIYTPLLYLQTVREYTYLPFCIDTHSKGRVFIIRIIGPHFGHNWNRSNVIIFPRSFTSEALLFLLEKEMVDVIQHPCPIHF